MTIKRVTVSDVAEACGLSRNTVSKVFNNRGSVPENVRRMVLQKAREMGYNVVVEEPAAPKTGSQNIALLTSHMPTDYHFGTFFIPAFADQLSRSGYTLRMCEITPEELTSGSLPSHLPADQTAGILAIELFDKRYHEMLCSLDIPLLFVDAYCGAVTAPLRCDIISMENTGSTFVLTNHLIESGAKRLGFVGDPEHCNSFQERWKGFCTALDAAALPLDRSCCILAPDSAQYGDPEWLLDQIRSMPSLPDAFVCANDFLAVLLLKVLKSQGISIPQDVMVTGFDGTPQSAVVEPSLTTAEIPSADIGRLAAEMLLHRIENRSRPFQITYVSTVPLLRTSSMRHKENG